MHPSAATVAGRVESHGGAGGDRNKPSEIIGKNYLLRLAANVEGAAATGAFAEAERLAKEAQGALSQAGDGAGSKLAFYALLLARKGDASGLRETATRMRAAAGGEGEEE